MTAYETAIQVSQNIKDPIVKAIVLDSLNNPTDFVKSVEAFHALYDCPNDVHLGTTENAQHMSDERIAMRLNLIAEEIQETIDAIRDKNIIEIADGISDSVYVLLGFALELGINMYDVFGEAHASNMTKLDHNGNVIRREDGKILKSKMFVKPDIRSVLKFR